MRAAFSSRSRRHLDRWLLLIGGLGLVLGLALHWYPVSVLASALSPDNSLEIATARFLDSLHYLLIFGSVVCVLLAWNEPMRESFFGAVTSPPSLRDESGTSPYWIPSIAVAAFLLRIGIGAISDIGLGDDGARVAWLKGWLLEPRPIWWGLWAPGHLYLQALAWLLVRDEIRAGILLSALASGGLAWILGQSVKRSWGQAAGACAAIGAAVLPVGVAYGATPDVSAPFAFLIVAAIASVGRYVREGRRVWIILALLAIAFASWSRFETFLLIPGIVAPLWHRRTRALWFGMVALVPTLVWHSLRHLFPTEATPSIVRVVLHDPWLVQRPLIPALFSFLGGLWLGLTLPFIAAGVLGVIRSGRLKWGREWLLILLLHLCAFIGMFSLTHGAASPRYYILPGSILAAYTGIWI